MEKIEARSVREAALALARVNHCHDASMIRVSFKKEREVDAGDGSLIYPFPDVRDFAKCDLEIELIHNSFSDARKDQRVLLEFADTRSFVFRQTEDYDYADVHELSCREAANSELEFSVVSTSQKIASLSVSCKKFVVTIL